MKRYVWLLFLVTTCILLFAACSPAVGPQETDATTAPTEATTAPAEATTAPLAAECPLATDNTYLLRNPQHGYCLLYPTTHKVERPNADEVNLVVGSLLNSSDPRANIRVMEAGSRSAETFADELIASFEGFEIDRSETTVAGQPAVVLDNVPGQDINRQIVFTVENRLYHILFVPIDAANSATMEAFMAGILGSFTPIPVSDAVTAEDECLVPKSEQQAITSTSFGFCVLLPADFAYEEPSATNANLFIGSMMDVQHPKLMIEVTEANSQTAAEAADELAASFPNMNIQRTFGFMLGYEPAELLDGVPGQDLGRVLLAVHDNRLYRLTFVPADPAQTDVYVQMEELFAMVIQTWRFLP